MVNAYKTSRRVGVGLVYGLVLWLGLARPAAAQTYTMPATGSATFTTCGGTLYDDGGASGPYSAYANGTVTLTPATAGNKIRLQFTSFSVENGYDRLYIYDGSSSTAPLIGSYEGTSLPGTVYATNSAGTLTLRLTSDYTVQYEGFAATIACVTTVPLADLAIQGASAQPLASVPGSSLTATCSIYNLSGTTAQSSSVGYYLSTDATLDANDQLLGSSTGGALGVGQSAYRAAPLPLPASTVPGNYFLLFAADHQNVVNESNESNNVVSVSVTVVPPSVDLVVQQAAVNTPNTAPGNVLGMSCTVYNQGNATASNSSVGYYLSADAVLDANDQLLTSSFGSQLTPGYQQYRTASANVPPGTTPGSYFVLFVADYQNVVNESNETNNAAAVAVTVSAPSVDVVVQQAQLSQTSAAAGSALNAGVLVFNQGNTQAAAHSLGVYLSADATLSANDALLTSTQVPALPGNQGYTVYPQFTVPAATAPGSYYVLFVADHQNQLSETNETNNVRSVAFTVQAPSVDLVMQQVYTGISSVAAGNSFNASSYIANQGNSAAASSNVGYYLSSNTTLDANDQLLGNSTGGSLAAGGYSSRYATLTVPAGTAAGQYYVLFVADYQNQVTETNEANNVSSASLSVVAAGVDLTLSQSSLSGYSVAAGGSVYGGVYINNQGTTGAQTSSVGFYLSANSVLDANDVLVGNSPGGYLYANDYGTRNATLTVPASTTPGSYYVLFVADYQNQVTETNENNNVVSQFLTVTAPFSGTVVPFSGTATITTCNATVYDHGGTGYYGNSADGTLVINPGTAGSKVQLNFSVFSLESCCDALTIYNGPSTSSPILGTYTYNPGTVTATNTSGALTLRFTSDGSVTYEGFQATATCVTGGSTSLADLVPSQPFVSASTVAPGASIYLSTYVYNQGQAAAASSPVGYFLSANATYDANDVALGTGAGSALTPGQGGTRSGTFTLPAGVAAGTYYLLHVADPLNSIPESNEANNVTYNVVTVSGSLPDLMVAQATLSAATAAAGSSLTANYVLANQGSGAAAFNSLGFFLSTDATWSSSDILLGSMSASSLGAGATLPGSIPLTIPAATVAGQYYVLFVADHNGNVTEASEANNVAARALTVAPVQSTRDEQLAGFALRVHPNPVASGSRLTVHLEGACNGKTADLALYDALGREVARQVLPLTGRPAHFDTRALPTGVYVLRLTGAGLNATRRVVVE